MKKNIKLLGILFAITLLLSKTGVLAYSTAPYKINKVKVGGADSSVYTSAARTKEQAGNQLLTDIEQNTKMKTKLQIYLFGKWQDGYEYWIELTSGINLIYPSDRETTFYPALDIPNDYRVRIAQSTWHFTDGTISATYDPGNNY